MFEQLFKEIWEGVNERFALELILEKQKIALTFSGSDQVLDFISSLIYANYPQVQISPHPQLSEVIPADWSLTTAELETTREDIIPLKSYYDLMIDALGVPVSVWTQLPLEGKYVAQYVAEPLPDTTYQQARLKFSSLKARLQHLTSPKYWIHPYAKKVQKEAIAARLHGEFFSVTARLAVSFPPGSEKTQYAQDYLSTMSKGYAPFHSPVLNSLRMTHIHRDEQARELLMERQTRKPFRLTGREFTSFWHMVSPCNETPVSPLLSKRLSPPDSLPMKSTSPDVALFGTNTYRGVERDFGLLPQDRLKHTYILGKTGTGKSKLLELLIRDDLEQGRGVAVIDPHGDLIDSVIRSIPKERINDVVLFHPADSDFAMSFNPCSSVVESQREEVAFALLQAFRSADVACDTNDREKLLLNAITTVLGIAGSTLRTVLLFLKDTQFRQSIIDDLPPGQLETYWNSEFLTLSDNERDLLVASLENKLGQLLASEQLHHVLDNPVSKIRFSEILEQKKIFLARLPKGILGSQNALFLASLLLARLGQAAQNTSSAHPLDQLNCSLYIDEFQCMTSELLLKLLKQATKSGLAIALANQNLSQLDESISKEVLDCIGTFISFQLSANDSQTVQEHFGSIDASDIAHLSLREFFIRLSVNGELSPPFTGKTLDVNHNQGLDTSNSVRDASRAQYAFHTKTASDIAQLWARAA